MKTRLKIATVMLLLTVASAASSLTLQELLERDDLRLRAWLEPETGAVVGEEVRVVIEVATRRWFAGGTRFRLPEVRDLIILRRDQFASNQSRREGETTWVIQQWHLELYPQRGGDLILPPLKLDLAVNDANAGVVRGAVETQSLSLTALVPPELAELEYWVATPELQITDSTDRELQGLAPGDAFRRDVQLQGTRITAMMLPQIQATAPPGLAAYADIPEMEDRSNRGEATAIRRQRITYVVENAGQYQLPEQVFYWWDTQSKELREAVLPALTIDAGGSATTPVGSAAESSEDFYWQPAPAWLALAVCLVLAVVLARYLRGRSWPVSEASQLRRVNAALRQGDSATAAALLYHWLNERQPEPDWLRLRIGLEQRLNVANREQLEKILADAFGGHAAAESAQLNLAASRQNKHWRKLRAWLEQKPPSLNP